MRHFQTQLSLTTGELLVEVKWPKFSVKSIPGYYGSFYDMLMSANCHRNDKIILKYTVCLKSKPSVAE